MRLRGRALDLVLAFVALAAIGAGLWHLRSTTDGLAVETVTIGQVPATVFRPAGVEAKGPVVVVAHGFAGSQQLMQPFAVTLARNGYVAVTFDFLGHGRNPLPLSGSITEADGATRALVGETGEVAAFAKGLGDGRLAILGHSMASDIIIRYAQSDPAVAASVAVSMFSPVVTASSPRDLLVIVGAWEGSLRAEALRVVGQASAPDAPRERVTYGDFAAGTARRTAFSDGVEHIGVLYSRQSMDEALGWLDQVFSRPRAPDAYLDARGPWIALLLAGIVTLARPLSSLLPRIAEPPAGAGLGWRRLWPLLALPAVATPLVLRVVPTHFLPVLVGDYLAVHFALYGVLTALGLWWTGAARPAWPSLRLVAAALAVAAYSLFGLGSALDTYVTSFMPGVLRVPLILAMLAGTLAFFLATEWTMRGPGAARGGYAASQAAFVVSLAIAVALDFERLFFLVIIVPVIVLFFLVYGLFSRWAYRRTGHPFVAGIANAILFAWAIGVTFPLLAG